MSTPAQIQVKLSYIKRGIETFINDPKERTSKEGLMIFLNLLYNRVLELENELNGIKYTIAQNTWKRK